MTALAAVGGNREADPGFKSFFFSFLFFSHGSEAALRCTVNQTRPRSRATAASLCLSDHYSNKHEQNRTCLKSEHSGKNAFLKQHLKMTRHCLLSLCGGLLKRWSY